MRIVNHRKNIVKAYHQELHRLKALKKYRAYDEQDWKYTQMEIAQSESRLKLLKELQEPLKDVYYL